MLRRQGEFSDDDDPLTKALTPPPNETLDQRDARLKAEKEAQLRSDAIDEEINRQRVAEKKESHCVRVLLLGNRSFFSTNCSHERLSQGKVNLVSSARLDFQGVCDAMFRQIYDFKE